MERIAEFTGASTDFAFETTLSGRAYVPLLHRMKKSGFRLHMFYLWIPNSELALLRIRDRVESGGHDVPERDVRRRSAAASGDPAAASTVVEREIPGGFGATPGFNQRRHLEATMAHGTLAPALPRGLVLDDLAGA